MEKIKILYVAWGVALLSITLLWLCGTEGSTGYYGIVEAQKALPSASVSTAHLASPSHVRGYIHENVCGMVSVGQEVEILSLPPAYKRSKGKVVGLGTGIVEYPESDLKCKAEAGRTIWVFLEFPTLFPDMLFTRPSDAYCQAQGYYIFVVNETLEDFYYVTSYPHSQIDFGTNDFSGLGELVIYIKKGDSPDNLQTIQTIRLKETVASTST